MLPNPPALGQALLFSPEIEVRVQDEERLGVYTAERFRALRPDAYQAVIQLLGADVGMQRIGKLLGIHNLTVAAVRDREPESVDIVRSKMVTKLRTAVLLQVERLIEHPESVPMNVTGLIIAQLIDKAELLDGRATQRVERTERVDIFATWDATVEKLLDPASVVEIEAPPAGIGLSGGNDLPIGASGEVDAPAELASDRAGSDEESLDSNGVTQVEEPTDTTTDTDRAADPSRSDQGVVPRQEPREQGGAGVSPAEGVAIAPIDSKTQNFSGNAPRPLPPAALI